MVQLKSLNRPKLGKKGNTAEDRLGNHALFSIVSIESFCKEAKLSQVLLLIKNLQAANYISIERMFLILDFWAFKSILIGYELGRLI